MSNDEYDVVVVGCGMAGLCAGLRAAERDLNVAILEKSPKERRGGQTRFSESFRVPSADTDLSEWGLSFDIDDYTKEQFYNDIMARTNGLADEDIARTLVESAPETMVWLTEHGVNWQMEPLAVGYTVGRTWFDGEEIVATLVEAAEEHGADIHYDAIAYDPVLDDDSRVVSIEATLAEERVKISCDAIVLASGGYESNPEMRAKYMGTGYDDMKVRGSRYNTGEAVKGAVAEGANAVGQWSGAHMALIDANAPDFEGGANRVDGYQYGVILNVNGERFLNEGEDARAHTYAKFGREIFEEPRHLAYVILDSKTHDLARATGPTEPFVADSIPELVSKLDVDERIARETVKEFNSATDPDGFDPTVLDGNETTGISPKKSNWSLPIDKAPFYAYPVTGGITFTFGGVQTTTDTEVLDSRERVIPGLYAAGNATGRLFFNNYPGGTGQTNAAVYGKIAAESIAVYLADCS